MREKLPPGAERSENQRKLALKAARNRRYKTSAKGKAAQYRARKRHAETHHGKQTQRRVKMLARYGITIAQYDKMFALQDGKCVGCGRPPKTKRLAVEHDHKTGRVRGLACHHCNRQLIARNTAETARWLVAYLSSEFDGRTL